MKSLMSFLAAAVLTSAALGVGDIALSPQVDVNKGAGDGSEIGRASALVISVTVDVFTDGGPAWQTALQNAGLSADLHYDPQLYGWPELSGYDLVVVVYNDCWWSESQGAWGLTDEAMLAPYEGYLVIVGQDYIYSLGQGSGPSAWLMARFGIVSVVEDVNYGDASLMTLTGTAGGPFEGLVDTGLPCWSANPWFTDDVVYSTYPTQDWSGGGYSGHGGAAMADGIFSTNAYECFDNLQQWVDAIVDWFGLSEECPWDFDDDGDVDTQDLLFLLGAWGTPAGDTDGDGDTDTQDLLGLLGHWGACP